MLSRFFSRFKSPQYTEKVSQKDEENPAVEPSLQSADAISEQQMLLTRLDELNKFKAELDEMNRAYDSFLYRWSATSMAGSLVVSALCGIKAYLINRDFLAPSSQLNHLLSTKRLEFFHHESNACTPTSFSCEAYYPNFILHTGAVVWADCTPSGYTPRESILCPDLFIQACLNMMDSMCDILNTNVYQYLNDPENQKSMNEALNMWILLSILTPFAGSALALLISKSKQDEQAKLAPVSASQKNKLQEYISRIGGDIHLNITKRWFGNEYINSAELYSWIEQKRTATEAALEEIDKKQGDNKQLSFFKEKSDEHRVEISSAIVCV